MENSNETTVIDPTEGQKALEAVMPALMAIPASEVRSFRAPVPQAVGIGLAHAESYQKDRSRFESTFKGEVFDVALYDNMAARSKAFWHADILHRQAEDRTGLLQSLSEEARRLRAKLMRAAAYLWSEDPVLGDTVSKIRSGNGHVSNADSLAGLATLFHDHWEEARGHCNVAEEDIAKAQSLGAELLRAKSPVKISDLDALIDTRNRAGEYLRRGIEEIRTAAAYVHRASPEALDRYPSLFLKGKRRASDQNSRQAEEPDAQTTASPEVQMPTSAGPLPLPMAVPVQASAIRSVA